MVKEVPIKQFDTKAVKRGSVVRLVKKDGSVERMGLVHRVRPDCMTLLYCNVQSSATSYFDFSAKEALSGEWEVFWSLDLKQVFHETGEDDFFQTEDEEDLDEFEDLDDSTDLEDTEG